MLRCLLNSNSGTLEKLAVVLTEIAFMYLGSRIFTDEYVYCLHDFPFRKSYIEMY